MSSNDANGPPQPDSSQMNSNDALDEKKTPTRKSLGFPPILLASYTLPMGAFATHLYSISRLTLFKFQPTVHISRWAAFTAFSLPAFLGLGWRLTTLLTSNILELNVEDLSTHLDYAIGHRVLVPSAIAAASTFLRRFLCEFLLMKLNPLSTISNVIVWKRTNFVFPIYACLGAYLSEFCIPLAYQIAWGMKGINIARIASTVNTILLDTALVNSYTHLHPAWALIPSISFLGTLFLSYRSFEIGSPYCTDLAYEKWLGDIYSTSCDGVLTWRKFLDLCGWALHLELAF